jgi:hypothetical protein
LLSKNDGKPIITQPSLKEQIVVKKQIKPSETELKGVNFQFIYHNDKHFFGHKKMWIDSFNRSSYKAIGIFA